MITWVLMWINIYFTWTENRVIFNEVYLIYGTNAMMIIVIAFQIYNVQYELLTILNIRLFHVKGKDWENPRFNPKWAKQCKENNIIVPKTQSKNQVGDEKKIK